MSSTTISAAFLRMVDGTGSSPPARFRSGRVVAQGLADLAHAGEGIEGRLLADRDPDDAVGKRLLHHLVVAKRLGEDRLADSAHALHRGSAMLRLPLR